MARTQAGSYNPQVRATLTCDFCGQQEQMGRDEAARCGWRHWPWPLPLTWDQPRPPLHTFCPRCTVTVLVARWRRLHASRPSTH